MRTFPAVLAALLVLVPGIGAATPSAQEIALGNKAYKEMLDNGELLSNAPQAKLLAPIAARLAAAANPIYGAPFVFYIHRSAIPNAFTVYGPRVYVDRGLVDFADDQQELAGVLCHEMSHVLHHDGRVKAAMSSTYDARVAVLEKYVGKMTHGHFVTGTGKIASIGEELMLLHHSREVEERADLAGAELCSRAGYNPWGLVWIFRKFQRVYGGGGFTFMSDHPDTKARIAALKKAFKKDPGTFGLWVDDEKDDGTPLHS
jgi:predicted Zn-dependent protease